MERLSKLLEEAAHAVPPALRGDVVVFGSAPLVLAGLRAQEVNDLDFFVPPARFERLRELGLSLDLSKPEMPRLRVGARIEIYCTWIGVTFEEVAAAAAPTPLSWGFPVASLPHVLAYKVAAGRDKDQPDIQLLRHALG